MAASSILPPVTSSVTSAPNPNATTTNTTNTNSASTPTLADNFTSFLQLLTTQLQNQNPLDPLDTNQFTQQLVEFSQVEQQLKSNDQLATLVSLQQTAQATNAISFVGKTVAVDGATAQLTNSSATWSFSVDKPATATVSIKSSTGQVVYSGSYTINPGQQQFQWDGRDNTGAQWPDGSYTMSVTASDANGQNVGVSTQVQGVIDSVDLTQSPPLLAIGGQTFTMDKIKRVVN
jgi:flagellar basal-body rod modification protein FlgD